MEGKVRLAVLFVFMILVTIVQVVAINTTFSQTSKGKFMELSISGGFAAMQIKVEYFKDGLVVYNNSRAGFFRNATIPVQLMDELYSKLNALITKYPAGLKLEAEPGSADYFTYVLCVNRDGKKVVFEWADTSKSPTYLSDLSHVLFKINNYVVGNEKIILLIETSKTVYQVGEKMFVKVLAINLAYNVFEYNSPTPCSPNFRVMVKTPDGRESEVSPIDSDTSKPCIQVVEKRFLSPMSMLVEDYEIELANVGFYEVRAVFPYAQWSETKFHDSIIVQVSP
ncbi:MAG: hypothetical protein QXJ17_00460 [Nitrososphaeria archaeon]